MSGECSLARWQSQIELYYEIRKKKFQSHIIYKKAVYKKLRLSCSKNQSQVYCGMTLATAYYFKVHEMVRVKLVNFR